jgi:hypothetical protein
MERRPGGVTLMGRFTVIHGPDIVGVLPTIEAVKASLRGAKPGRYIVEESAPAQQVLPSGYSTEGWGVALVRPDGSVELEPEPGGKGRTKG